MELGFLILFGLTITSSTGFSLSISRPLLPLGGGGGSSSRRPGMRFPGIQERDGEEAETVAAGRLLPGVSGSDTSVKKVADPEELHHRTKRCTCYTYRDKECVYYCHLDIIWINTPECEQNCCSLGYKTRPGGQTWPDSQMDY